MQKNPGKTKQKQKNDKQKSKQPQNMGGKDKKAKTTERNKFSFWG